MTYSIIAKDKKTGNLGITVQTHWFGVGNNVPWLKSGIGAIATQAQTEMNYGKKGLQLLEGGLSAEEALKQLVEEDNFSDTRQVAIIDNFGNIAAHTGKSCISYAGFLKGDDFIVQGNILTNEKVLGAMYESYKNNFHLDFAERLIESIYAGEIAGGELRGVQSAAIKIVSGNKDEYDILNLKVDDNTKPLDEIKRQLNIAKGYDLLNKAEELGQSGTIEDSLSYFEKSESLLPENKEILFWKAYMLKNRGEQEKADEILKKYFKQESLWLDLWERISTSTH